METSLSYYNVSEPASFTSAKKLKYYNDYTLPKIQSWLNKQRTYSLHKPAKKRLKQYRMYKASHYLYQVQADLIDMIKYSHQNKTYKYILTVIDIFTRFAWVEPLKTKSSKEMVSAFKRIGIKPRYLQTDQGTEFYNIEFKNFLASNKVKLFSVFSDKKCAIVERFNRTLKEKLFKYFTFNNTTKWVSVLQDVASSYNNTVHSSIKMTPIEAKKAKNWQIIWKNWHATDRKVRKSKLKVGDVVRISRIKGIFDKGYIANWSEQIYTINTLDTRDQPPMYELKDYKDEIVKGKFYEAELQQIPYPEYFPIEKVYKRGKDGYLVKFLGYPEKYWTNAIINNK